MLVQTKLKTFLELVGDSTKEELIWMNGYLSGMVSTKAQPENGTAGKPLVGKITIAYGTETGHSKSWPQILQPVQSNRASLQSW